MEENQVDKLKEAIKRLDEIPPSKWDYAMIIKVKTWLFPRFIAYLDGYREETMEAKVEKVFGKEEGGDLT